MDFNVKFLLERDYKYLSYHFVALYRSYKINKKIFKKVTTDQKLWRQVSIILTHPLFNIVTDVDVTVRTDVDVTVRAAVMASFRM